MAAKKKEKLKVVVGSGNIYADFGFPNPEEALAKAKLAALISDQIKIRKLTQKKAAKLMEIDQPKVSDILRGKLSDFSMERLLRFLVFLGFDILIQPKKHTVKNTQPGIHIIPQANSKARRLTT